MSSDEIFLQTLAEALEAVRLDALVVGSIAAAIQGATIVTQDVDLLIRDTPQNRKKLIALARALDTDPAIPIAGLTQALTFARLEPHVDILFDGISGNLKFASLKSRRVIFRLGGAKLAVISLDDVIASKRAANRTKDRAQLPNIEETRRLRKTADLK